MRVSLVLLLLLGCLIQGIVARSLVKEYLILKFIKNLIKPRFVPLPLPLPLPIKFIKHTHKAYPVPFHGHHAFSAHDMGPSPLSFHLGGGYDSLIDSHDFSGYGHGDYSSFGHGHHELSALSSADYGHPDFSSLASIDQSHHGFSGLSSYPSSHGHYQLTHLPSLPHEGQLEVGSIPGKYASTSHLTPSDRRIIQSLIDSAELTKVPSQKHITTTYQEEYVPTYDDSTEIVEDDSTKLQLSAANDEVLQNLAHASEMSYESESHGDSTHADIDAVGGFDFLTDLHDVGDGHEWWK